MFWSFKAANPELEKTHAKIEKKCKTRKVWMNSLLNPFADGRTQDNMQSANTVKGSYTYTL